MNISVVIPTYNRVDYLFEAIKSVLYQSFLPYEVIIINDNGIENNLIQDKILKNFQSATVPIKYYVNTGPKGVSSARNYGAKISAGDILAFLDDDDIWHQNYLEKVMKRMQIGYDLVCASFMILEDKNLIPEKTAPLKLITQEFFCKNPGIRGSNIFIRKQAFKEIGGFDTNLLSRNDLDFGIRVSLNSRIRYAGIKDRLVYWRCHSGERLSQFSDGKKQSVQEFYNKYKHLMTKSDKEKYIKHVNYLWNINLDNL
jgi:glycosyltransferase involved in cell wall biosynthesis